MSCALPPPQNGRIKGEGKKALRAVIEKYGIPVTITCNQNLILREIEPAWKEDILATLGAGGIKDIAEWDSIERTSMACPALPLCGLATTEAERALPDINVRLRNVCNKVGLSADEHFVVRMTGCPNGCARPYMAEIGFVGDGPNSYQVGVDVACCCQLTKHFHVVCVLCVASIGVGSLARCHHITL